MAGTLTLGSNSSKFSIELERFPYLQATSEISAIVEMKDTNRDAGEGGE